MDKNTYISTSFLWHFNELVASRDGDVETLFLRAGIPLDVANGDIQLIPLESFIRLLEITSRALHFPDFPLALAQKQDLTYLGPLSVMLFQCKTMQDVARVISQYIRLAISGVTVVIKESGDNASVQFRCDLPYIQNSPQYQDYVLATAANTMWELLGRRYGFRGCFFSRMENDEKTIHRYIQYFGCPVAFGSDRLGITVNRQILDEPAAAIHQYINVKIQRLMQTKQALVYQVEKVISMCLASKQVDIDTVAQSMGYSRRTLQRRLDSANTSFSEILDNVRLSQANQYLFNTTYRMTDIASLLGYSNLSSFTRSYKRWQGIEPGKAREAYQLRHLNRTA